MSFWIDILLLLIHVVSGFDRARKFIPIPSSVGQYCLCGLCGVHLMTVLGNILGKWENAGHYSTDFFPHLLSFMGDMLSCICLSPASPMKLIPLVE